MIIEVLVMSILLSGVVLCAGLILNKKSQVNFFSSPFECGINITSASENPLSLRFFLLTVVFLVFDVELVLIIPYVLYDFLWSSLSIAIMFIFFLISLVFGVFLEWNSLCFEWT